MRGRNTGGKEGKMEGGREGGREGGKEGGTYLVQEVEAFSGVVGRSEEIQQVFQQAQELHLGREGGRGEGRKGWGDGEMTKTGLFQPALLPLPPSLPPSLLRTCGYFL
jgi:hypothetical protein